MRFDNTEVWGFWHAIRGMRNPKNSWDRSDSSRVGDDVYIGPDDMRLMQQLIKAGPEHRKFLRQIFVSVDITAPLYWWKEFDTYKIGTVSNSCSTMHKLASTPITVECFEMDDARCEEFVLMEEIAAKLEAMRLKYLREQSKSAWKQLIRFLPESWLQKRTITMNYENVMTICHQRMNHKLNEWSGRDYPLETNFIKWAKGLPYAEELIFFSDRQEGDAHE